jgi:hypothetical protein
MLNAFLCYISYKSYMAKDIVPDKPADKHMIRTMCYCFIEILGIYIGTPQEKQFINRSIRIIFNQKQNISICFNK